MDTITKFAGINIQRKQPCYMRDGVILYSDIYYPDTKEELPVLLMRQPYGRAIASTVSHAHPVWYAKHGYIVVIQDVRGKWDSEGQFSPFIQEANDGYDTVEWAAKLPGSNGKVGMYGFSYQGSTQWAAASAAPPHLKAIAPAMCAADLYHGMFYPHGSFLLKEHLPWAYQLARDNARRAGDVEAEHQSAMAMKNPEALYWQLPIEDGSGHPLLEKYFPEYRQWCEHAQYDEYWLERDWIHQIKQQQAPIIPALHIGGWYDVFLMGTYQSYNELKNVPGGKQHRLVIGPWSHIPWGRTAGGYDHGEEADGNIHQLQLEWFDYWLKDKGEMLNEDASISYYEFGSNQWRSLKSIEQLSAMHWFIKGGQKPANGLLGGGRLSNKLEVVQEEPLADLFVYDARQPMRLDSYLPVDRKEIQDRYEILVYSSDPLQKELRIFGAPKVSVQCESLPGPTDIVAILSIVMPDGSARLLSCGRAELTLDISQLDEALTIPMKPCAAYFPVGSKLRLEFTGSAFPLFTRHPNHKETTANKAKTNEMNIATVAIYSDRGMTSYLELPIFE